MTVREIKESLGLQLLAGEQGLDRETEGCYCGDLLSWVMSRAEEKNIWLTVMGNINSIAVAVLAEISCIILTENAELLPDAKARADLEGIPVLSYKKNAYHTAVELYKLLNESV